MGFLSTLSLRRATVAVEPELGTVHNFYPRSPCGERRSGSQTPTRAKKFLSTLSLRRATRAEIHASTQQEFLSTLSLRRATCDFSQKRHPPHNFYPRSPCGERQDTPLISIAKPDFYPRSPCGERQPSFCGYIRSIRFLSTLSLRRATHYDNYNLHCVEISIHALLAESDP